MKILLIHPSKDLSLYLFFDDCVLDTMILKNNGFSNICFDIYFLLDNQVGKYLRGQKIISSFLYMLPHKRISSASQTH